MSREILTTLNKEIEDFLTERGAIRVGFATLETLAGGPPSTDLKYVLPEAKSAIIYALPLDRKKIRDFLAKKEHYKAELDDKKVNEKIHENNKELAKWLQEKGHNAVALKNNNIYRTELKGWKRDMHPDISHRYLAAVSGVGSFGWSGNIGIKGFGTAIMLGAIVTDAELAPTPRIPPEEGFCTNCKLCVAVCPAGFFDAREEIEVIIGSEKFTYSKRHDKFRCQLVCGGFAGLHKSGKWSTWSPGRFKIPDDDEKLFPVLADAFYKYTKWPERKPPGGVSNPIAPDVKLRMTCGMCQKVCTGNEEKTRQNYELLINSGCVIQNPDGEILVLPPEEAQEAFDALPRKHRKLYC
ncbi:MAG: epoxyqueuosine reductase [Candidatus Helarchaeota archaeon]